MCRLDILEVIVRVHLTGVQHNDLRQENLRRKADPYSPGPWVIDFGNAEKHNCLRCMEIVEGAVKPQSHEFRCDELWEICLELGIWRSRKDAFQVEGRSTLTLVHTIGYVHWFGRNIPDDCVTSPQVLIDAARRACVPGPQEEIATMAEAMFKRVQRYKKNDGLRPRNDVESDDE